MSNRVILLATEFKDSSGSSYGFRVADDYDKAYWNMSDQSMTRFSDLDLFAEVLEFSEFSEFRDYIVENRTGLTINDTWYSFEELTSILKYHGYLDESGETL